MRRVRCSMALTGEVCDGQRPIFGDLQGLCADSKSSKASQREELLLTMGEEVCLVLKLSAESVVSKVSFVKAIGMMFMVVGVEVRSKA